MKLKRFGAIAAAVMWATTPALADNVQILFNNFVPPQHYMWQALPQWADQVEEVTEGRVTIMMPAKSLAPPPEQWNSVETGIFDGAWIFNGFAANRVTGPLIAHVPWTSGDDSTATSVALWRTHEAFFAEKNEYDGVKLLGLFTFAGAELYSLDDTAINSVDELASRKMWTLPGAATDAAKQVGSGIVSSPATKVHEYVSRNVVSGFFGITKDAAMAYKAGNYAQNVTVFPRKVFNASFSLFVSDKIWATISPEDQAAIESVSGEALARLVGEISTEREMAAKDAMLANGSNFVESDASFYSALQDATDGIRSGWVEKANALGVDGEAALAFYEAEVKKLEADMTN